MKVGCVRAAGTVGGHNAEEVGTRGLTRYSSHNDNRVVKQAHSGGCVVEGKGYRTTERVHGKRIALF